MLFDVQKYSLGLIILVRINFFLTLYCIYLDDIHVWYYTQAFEF